MESRTRRGFLVPADVSGVTAFLTSSELDYAQDIIGELLDPIVRRLIPPFEHAEVEGDAVYVYATEGAAPAGEHLLPLPPPGGERKRPRCGPSAINAPPGVCLRRFRRVGFRPPAARSRDNARVD
ncbi:MAG TPA: hypothetical protein VFI11_12015 [Anaerolineales bacterium]|nr:hypothetical protein [Anaerolineales bacterium]